MHANRYWDNWRRLAIISVPLLGTPLPQLAPHQPTGLVLPLAFLRSDIHRPPNLALARRGGQVEENATRYKQKNSPVFAVAERPTSARACVSSECKKPYAACRRRRQA
jgi:hypothetical protein